MSPDELSAIEQIKQLKARYFRTLDTRDWCGFGNTFSVIGTLEVESNRSSPDRGAPRSRKEHGRDAIVTWVSGVLAGATSIHHGYMPEIRLLAPARASGVWAMEDLVIWSDRSLHGWGHYHEDYAFDEGAWRITFSRLSRLHVEIRREAGAAIKDQPQMLDMRI